MKRGFTFFGLIAAFALASFSFLPPPDAAAVVVCPPPCKRSVCRQQCGDQLAAFCDVDLNGCTYCACYG